MTCRCRVLYSAGSAPRPDDPFIYSVRGSRTEEVSKGGGKWFVLLCKEPTVFQTSLISLPGPIRVHLVHTFPAAPYSHPPLRCWTPEEQISWSHIEKSEKGRPVPPHHPPSVAAQFKIPYKLVPARVAPSCIESPFPSYKSSKISHMSNYHTNDPLTSVNFGGVKDLVRVPLISYFSTEAVHTERMLNESASEIGNVPAIEAKNY